MTFTINTLTRCAGQSHWTLNITVAGQPYVIQTTPEEMTFDPLASTPETRLRVLERCRSAAKEASAVTFTQAQTALQGKSFQL
jgi:hypothetical protein